MNILIAHGGCGVRPVGLSGRCRAFVLTLVGEPLSWPLRFATRRPLVRWTARIMIHISWLIILVGTPLALGIPPLVALHQAFPGPVPWHDIAVAFSIMFFPALVVYALLVKAGWLRIEPQYDRATRRGKLFRRFLGPLPLATLEEAVFRGILLEQLLRSFPQSHTIQCWRLSLALQCLRQCISLSRIRQTDLATGFRLFYCRLPVWACVCHRWTQPVATDHRARHGGIRHRGDETLYRSDRASLAYGLSRVAPKRSRRQYFRVMRSDSAGGFDPMNGDVPCWTLCAGCFAGALRDRTWRLGGGGSASGASQPIAAGAGGNLFRTRTWGSTLRPSRSRQS